MSSIDNIEEELRSMRKASAEHHSVMHEVLGKVSGALIQLATTIEKVHKQEIEVTKIRDVISEHSEKIVQIDVNKRDIVKLEASDKDISKKVDVLSAQSPVNKLTSKWVIGVSMFLLMSGAVFVGEVIHHAYKDSIAEVAKDG